MNNKKWYLYLIALISMHSYAAQIVNGNVTDGTQSFNFPIRAHAYHEARHRFFVGANEAVADNNFALAAAANSTQFFGLTPKNVAVNNVADQENPLHGAKIEHLALMGENPLVVKSSQENIIHLVNDYKDLSKISIISSNPLPDLHNAVSAGIVGLASNSPEALIPDVSLFFAAVKNNAGAFGQPGSGIILGLFKSKKVDDKTLFSFEIGSAVPLDTTSPAIGINNNAASIDNVEQNQPVDMHWGYRFLYTALLVTGGPDAADGARGIVRGNLVVKAEEKADVAQKIVQGLGAIAPDAAFTANSIVGGVGPSVHVSMHFVRTLFTSTLLDYLIVVGGVGAPADTKRMVFALPLVNDDSVYRGMLAKKDAIPVAVWENHLSLKRIINTPAAHRGDLFEPHDIPAIVGGTGILPGDITSIRAVNDAVFVSVGTDGVHDKAGIFYSQALFDDLGRIKGWTSWRRAAGSTSPIFGFALDTETANFCYMPALDANSITSVKRTAWALNSPQIDDVQGLFDLSALVIATGNKHVTLLNRDTGVLAPVVKFSGGVLDELGAISCAACVEHADNRWLVVGGSGGLAVLVHDDGVDFDASMKFRKIGNYKNVRKIIADNDTLYVLTSQQLERITPSTQTFSGNTALNAATIAQPTQLPNGNHVNFSDIAVSGKFGLLATNAGLLRVGNDGDISTAPHTTAVNWTAVTIPESVGPVTRILAISPTALETEFATTDNGGNVYILNASVGYHQARVYRFTIANTTSNPINDTTCTLFPDYFVKDKRTFFLNVGDYRNYIATDGALFFFSRSAYKQATPFLEQLSSDLHSGKRSAIKGRKKVLEIAEATSIGRLIRCSATGSWMIGGDFGLHVNE